MSLDNKSEFNQTVLYFRAPNSERSSHHAHLKGSKLRSKDENKIYELRTKHVDRYNLWQLSRSTNQEEDFSISAKKKNSLDTIRHKNYMKNSFTKSMYLLWYEGKRRIRKSSSRRGATRRAKTPRRNSLTSLRQTWRGG